MALSSRSIFKCSISARRNNPRLSRVAQTTRNGHVHTSVCRLALITGGYRTITDCPLRYALQRLTSSGAESTKTVWVPNILCLLFAPRTLVPTDLQRQRQPGSHGDSEVRTVVRHCRKKLEEWHGAFHTKKRQTRFCAIGANPILLLSKEEYLNHYYYSSEL